MDIKNIARTSLMRVLASLRADRQFIKYQEGQILRGYPRALVVEMHETPVADEGLFRSQLEWVSKHFSIVSLDRFADLWRSAPETLLSEKKIPVLFTFDDGRESNYKIAAPLLESFGARGVFFVVPQFAECAPSGARDFYCSHINPGARREWAEDWKPMTPDQIADLARRGHDIGNHTFSHARLRGLSEAGLMHQIVESAERITSWTNKRVEAFAWTFSWDAIELKAWKLIREHHRFCFTPCPGMVDFRQDSLSLIWRQEVEVRYSPAEFRFFYSGLGGLLWAKRRSELRTLLQAKAHDQGHSVLP